MTSRVEAGRLTHADLGKIVTTEKRMGYLLRIEHGEHGTAIWLRSYVGAARLDPHTLVTITGKDTHDG